MRHTTFRFCLDPTVEQDATLTRHAGASRFASNTCLRLVKDALTAKQDDPAVKVPWTGFDLINTFNAWKKTEAAGRRFVVDGTGATDAEVTGLAWRAEVCQQVFEEAAVDLGKALAAFTASRKGDRAGCRVGFPRFKRKGKAVESFRLRNKHPTAGKPAIRVGDCTARSVTLPGIGRVRVHDDTRRLRRLSCGRGRVLFATVSRRAGRWYVSLNVEAADLHPGQRHDPELVAAAAHVGVDRGLHDLAVAATSGGAEAARIPAPKHLAQAQAKQRRLARAVTRKRKGSANRKKAAARLGRHHHKTRNRRHHVLHAAANRLAQYPRVAVEDLNVHGMLGNHRLARAISDAAWADLARLLKYRQDWRGGGVVTVDRWFPSSKTCSGCGAVDPDLTLAQRTYRCASCGLVLDRDLNAARNLAAWADAQAARDREATGPDTNARRGDGSGQRSRAGETSPSEAGTRHAAA